MLINILCLNCEIPYCRDDRTGFFEPIVKENCPLYHETTQRMVCHAKYLKIHIKDILNVIKIFLSSQWFASKLFFIFAFCYSPDDCQEDASLHEGFDDGDQEGRKP